jgi:hypothetical protein
VRILRYIIIAAAALAVQIGHPGAWSAAPDSKEVPAQIVEQLKLSQQALAAHGLPLQLVGYTAAKGLDTDAAVRSAQESLVADSAVVPQYDGTQASSFSVSSIAERKKAFQSGSAVQDVVANIRTMAFPTIKKGQKTLNVTWESQGRKFQTRLVYDDKGVVYDNVLSNLAFVEQEQRAAEAPPSPPKEEAQAEAAAAKRNAKWSTRFLNYTIRWAWGATRGKITLDHYVITCDRWHSFCDHGGQANAWMSLGKADAKARSHSLKKPRIAKLAWAYGWATPTASFSIKWEGHGASFSVDTGGIGSSGKGSGIHALD